MVNNLVKASVVATIVASVSLGGFFLDDRFVKANDLKPMIQKVNKSLDSLYKLQEKLSVKIDITNKRARIRDIQLSRKSRDCGEMEWLCVKLEVEILEMKAKQ